MPLVDLGPAPKLVDLGPAPIFDPEQGDYDIDTARDAGMKRTDGHMGSLDPRTGMVLKARSHPTWGLMQREEDRLGNKVVKHTDGRYYSVGKNQPFKTASDIGQTQYTGSRGEDLGPMGPFDVFTDRTPTEFDKQAVGALAKGGMRVGEAVTAIPENTIRLAKTIMARTEGLSERVGTQGVGAIAAPGKIDIDEAKIEGGLTKKLKSWTDMHRRGQKAILAAHPEWASEPPKNVVDLLTSPRKLALSLLESTPLLLAAGITTAAGQPALSVSMMFTTEFQDMKNMALADGRSEQEAQAAGMIYAPIAAAIEQMQLQGIINVAKGTYKPLLTRTAQKVAAQGLSKIKYPVIKTAVNEALEEIAQGTWQEATAKMVYDKSVPGGVKGFLDRRAQEAVIGGTLGLVPGLGGKAVRGMAGPQAPTRATPIAAPAAKVAPAPPVTPPAKAVAPAATQSEFDAALAQELGDTTMDRPAAQPPAEGKVYYHGTTQLDIDKTGFVPSESLRQTDTAGGTKTVKSPVLFVAEKKETADFFGENRAGFRGKPSKTFAVKFDPQNTLDLTGNVKKKKIFDAFEAAGVDLYQHFGFRNNDLVNPKIPSNANFTPVELSQFLDDPAFIDKLKAQGFDSVRIQEAKVKGKSLGKSLGILSPEQATIKPLTQPPTPKAAEGKQPWEMTKEEVIWEGYTPDGASTERALKGRLARWEKIRREADAENVAIEVVEKAIATEKARIARAASHRTAVQQALAEGKPVPAEVLAEYPDLKPPTGKLPGGRQAGFLSIPWKAPSPELLREGAEKSYQKYMNRFASIENVTKKAKKLGMEIKPGENPVLRARSYLGLGRKVESVLRDQTYRTTPEGQIELTGEGLKPILDAYDKLAKPKEKRQAIREKDFKDYLTETRTVEDLQRSPYEGAPQIVSPKQVETAQRTLAKLNKKYGEGFFGDIANRLYEYQKRVLHLLVDAGNLSQAQYDTIVALNPHYIPFDRVMDETEAGVPRQKGRFTRARAPVKRIKGSDLDIQDPIESIIKNTYSIVDRAERNQVARSIANLGEVLPQDISPIKVKMRPVRISERETGGEETTIFRPSQFAPKGNVVEYFADGKRKYIEVTPNLYKAMTGMNEMSASVLVNLLSKPAHWLRVGATSTPEFMVRNVIRDQFVAFMQTSVGFVPFVDSIGAIADVVGKTQDYHDWLRSGGAYSGFVELNRPALENAYKELRGKKSLLGKLNIIGHAQGVSQVLEQATRVAVYKRARKKGKSAVEAGFISREASVDFARIGSSKSIQDLNRVKAFLNAQLQGIDQSVRSSIKNPYSLAIKGFAAITIPSLLLYLRNRDEDDYEQMAQWKKDLFWNFKVGEQWWRIPKPFLYGQIFGSLPERFFEYIDTKDKKAFDGLAKSLYDAASPIAGRPETGLLPTALNPLIENWVDKNFFLERPVVGPVISKRLPQDQYTRYTTESAKQLGKHLKYSPAKIENLIRGYTGGTGRYALEGADALVNAIKKEAKPKRPTELSDIPLVKGFVSRRPFAQPEDLNKFYERREKITQAYNSYRNLQREGKKKDAAKFLAKHPEVRLNKSTAVASKRLTGYRKQIQKIEDSQKPAQQKRKEIIDIERKRLVFIKKVNQITQKK